MNTLTSSEVLDNTLNFYTGAGICIPLHAVAIELITLGSEPIEARLTLEADQALYQQLTEVRMPGLQPELRRPVKAEINSNVLMQIEASLGAGLLVRLSGCTSAAEAADILLRWNREAPEDPLFSVDNWFTLRVKSVDGSDSYSTLWAELAPSRLAQELSTGHIAPLIEAMTMLAELRLTDTGPVKEESLSLMGQLINYLDTEGWPYLSIEGQLALQLAYQGESGTWTCFARTREDQNQMVFYSVCPICAPESRRAHLTEFLMLANFGLIIGNFELNLEDGEIRYKTSLDVADKLLPPAAIQRSIAVNVQTMDRYLPGILAVVSGEMLPADAIDHIEGQS